MTNPDLLLNDGQSMPQLGLGLMRFGSEAETAAVLARAADAGYRLFDSAAVYGNEQQVGEGLRQSGLARGDVFVTTKLWNIEHGREKPRAALAGSLQRLGLDQVDLYLIHWPLPMDDLYVETWRALIELRDEGLVRSIGVSNFTVEHLGRLIAETGVAPAVNQVEMHPRFQQRDLQAFHGQHGVIAQAWSPFGGGGTGGVPLLGEPVLEQIAAKHVRTPSQVVLRWLTQSGASAIPKATSAQHLVQNMTSLSFDLDEADLAAIATLDSTEGRTGPDPQTFAVKHFA